MDYEEFKKKLVGRLQEHFGKNVEVEIRPVKRNNGISHESVQISDGKQNVIPVIGIDGLYEAYRCGSMEMQECVEEICMERREYEATENIVELANKVMDWNAVKDNIYPILLSTKKNKELLKDLVSTPMLDLSVAYIIRMEMPEESRGSIKVSRRLMQYYQIDEGKLHRQAMENLAKDGYKFLDMESFIRDMFRTGKKGEDEDVYSKDSGKENICPKEDTQAKMYVLTNKDKSYGAAGILNKELVREFAKGEDFFILPSSIHETIFVPVRNASDKEMLDSMVEDVNKTQVSAEEQLSDHCYYYDGQTDEVTLCA